MHNPLALQSSSPYGVGAAIGVLSWFAFWSADHPIGITTAFEHTAALVGQAVVSNIEQTHSYYADRAREGNSPKIGWEWMRVVGGMVIAAIIALMFLGRGRHGGTGWLPTQRHGHKQPGATA